MISRYYFYNPPNLATSNSSLRSKENSNYLAKQKTLVSTLSSRSMEIPDDINIGRSTR